MKLFRTTAAALMLASASLSLSAQAEVVQQNTSGDPLYTVEAPKGYAMVGDLVVARPLLIGLTALGTAAFVVSLPFTALGGNVGEAAQALVVEPGKEAFVRCLGCTSSGYKQD